MKSFPAILNFPKNIIFRIPQNKLFIISVHTLKVHLGSKTTLDTTDFHSMDKNSLIYFKFFIEVQ